MDSDSVNTAQSSELFTESELLTEKELLQLELKDVVDDQADQIDQLTQKLSQLKGDEKYDMRITGGPHNFHLKAIEKQSGKLIIDVDTSTSWIGEKWIEYVMRHYKIGNYKQ